jgi:hypothetical protein
MLVAVVVGLLQADAGDFRVFGLLIGPLLMFIVAEVGYLMVRVFYHRFMDASLALINISRMLRLDDLTWVSDELAPPLMVSRYGGFASQWVGAREWLKQHRDLDLEAAKQAILGQQVSTPIGLLRGHRRSLPRLPTVTLTAARRTMWAFEASGLLLVPVIIATGV